MFLKPLRDLFAQVCARLRGPEKTVPWNCVSDLLHLNDERYAQDPYREFIVRRPNSETWSERLVDGPVRTFYAEAGQTLSVECQPIPDSVVYDGQRIGDAETETIEIAASSSIITNENKGNFTAAICEPVTDPDCPFPVMAFAIHGIRETNGDFRIRKMEVPAINDCCQMTGLRSVNLNDGDDVAVAWTYARLCMEQMLSGEDRLTPRTNMQKAMALPAAQRLLPWEPASAGPAAPPQQNPS